MYYFANLYISLIPLWISIIFKLSYKYFISYGLNIRCDILKNHIFQIVFVIVILLLLGICWKIFGSFLNIKNKVESNNGYVVNYNIKRSFTMEYVFMYVLPLFAFDFISVDGIILFLIYYLFVAFLVCKYRYFTGNIICEIMQYKYYDCEIKTSTQSESYLKKIVISREEIINGYNISIYNINSEVSLDITQ